MTTPQPPCALTPQAVAWALHVLEPDEESEMLVHLPGCAECRAVVRETEETLAALGGALEPEEPPAGLRGRILDEALRTPQEVRADDPVASSAGEGAVGATGSGAAGSEAVDPDATRTDSAAVDPDTIHDASAADPGATVHSAAEAFAVDSGPAGDAHAADADPGTPVDPGATAGAPGAAGVGAAGSGPAGSGDGPRRPSGRPGGPGSGPGRGAGGGRHSRPGRRRGGLRGRVVAVATAAVIALGAIAGLGVYSAQLRSERDAEAARSQALVSMVQQMATPGATHAFLAPTQGEPAVAAVVATTTGQQIVVPVALPANPGDHVYVLWGLPGEGTPTPLGTFDVGADGAGVQSVGSSPDGTGFAQFAISIEPGRAAPASPSDVVASGRAEI